MRCHVARLWTAAPAAEADAVRTRAKALDFGGRETSRDVGRTAIDATIESDADRMSLDATLTSALDAALKSRGALEVELPATPLDSARGPFWSIAGIEWRGPRRVRLELERTGVIC